MLYLDEKQRKKKNFQTNMQSIYLCCLLPHCLSVSCGEKDLIHFVYMLFVPAHNLFNKYIFRLKIVCRFIRSADAEHIQTNIMAMQMRFARIADGCNVAGIQLDKMCAPTRVLQAPSQPTSLLHRLRFVDVDS